MARAELIEAILEEMERVWSDEGFSGTPGEYEWLREHYGIEEDEDVEWLGILAHDTGDVDPEDVANPTWMSFVTDDEKVIPFLTRLLEKYRSSSTTAPTR